MTFDPADIERDVSIPILSDGVVESTEKFFGQLSLVEGERRGVRLGQINSTTITILDSDGRSCCCYGCCQDGGGERSNFCSYTVGVSSACFRSDPSLSLS